MCTTKGEEHQAAKTGVQRLGDKPYFGGDTFGYVDVALVPFYCYFGAYETHGNLSMEAECPKLVAWAKRCVLRESVSRSLPDQKKLMERISYFRKRLGLEL
ncbi:hypothetical protein RJ641_002830, partial [Dillenia turbinata]